jgi:hypothetical protein
MSPRRATVRRTIASLGLALASGIALNACRALGVNQSPIEAGAVVAALQSMPLDSICGSGCPVIQLDSVIRTSRTLLAYYPADRPAILQLVTTPTQLRLGWRTLQVVGRWSVPDSMADTLRLAAYAEQAQDSGGGPDRQLIGLAVLLPGSVLRTWAVQTTRSPSGWQVTRRWLSFEP